MKCTHCGYDLNGTEKFCPNCGQAIDINGKQETGEDNVVDASSDKSSNTHWYFVENNESKGPFTESQMKEFYDSGRINDLTYVWHDGQSDWESLKVSSLAFGESQETKVDGWYFIDLHQNQHGPYTKSQMNGFLANNTIGANTYVWREGMADWDTLNHTELYSRSIYPQMRSNESLFIKHRSILSCILLSIFTCGIYAIYWQYSIARDMNTLLRSNGYPEDTSPAQVVIFSFITLGIYGIYFLYKVAKNLNQIEDVYNNNALLYVILSIFGLSIVAYAIIQDNINHRVDA